MSQVPASHQTLAVGTNPSFKPSSRYGALGGFSDRMTSSPSGIRGAIVGAPGSGKTAFIQTCPDGFILNCDLSTTTVPGTPGGPPAVPKALSWPGVNGEGKPIDDNGQPFILTWDRVQAKLTLLEQLAKSNSPRPKTIFIDHLGSCVRMLKEWIPLNADALNLKRGGAAHWKDLDGKAAWDCLYDILSSLLVRLHSYGYGVYYLMHVVNTKVQLGEDRTAFIPELSVTDNFWKRLYGNFDFIGVILREQVPVTSLDPRFDPGLKKYRTTMQDRTVLTMGTQLYTGITKTRVPTHTIVLDPADDAWAVFSKAYNEASARGTVEVREVPTPPPTA